MDHHCLPSNSAPQLPPGQMSYVQSADGMIQLLDNRQTFASPPTRHQQYNASERPSSNRLITMDQRMDRVTSFPQNHVMYTGVQQYIDTQPDGYLIPGMTDSPLVPNCPKIQTCNIPNNSHAPTINSMPFLPTHCTHNSTMGGHLSSQQQLMRHQANTGEIVTQQLKASNNQLFGKNTIRGGPGFDVGGVPRYVGEPTMEDGIDPRTLMNEPMMYSIPYGPQSCGFNPQNKIVAGNRSINRVPPEMGPLIDPQNSVNPSGYPTSSFAVTNCNPSVSQRLNDDVFGCASVTQSVYPSSARDWGLQQSSQPMPNKNTNRDSLNTMTAPFPVPPPFTNCALCFKDIATPPEKGDRYSNGMRSDRNGPCLRPQIPVQCEAGCRSWYHLTCSGLTQDAYCLLQNEPMAEWLCTPCATRAYPNIPYIRLRQ